MQNKKKKIIIIVVAVILVILITLLTIILINIEKNKQKEVSNLNQNAIENNIIENKTENTIENELITNTIVEETEKEENNSTAITPDKGEEEVTKTEIEKEVNDKEKAINIAKKAWGEDNNVYFTFETIDSKGNYIVYVREAETTRAISAYTINIQTGTYTKE